MKKTIAGLLAVWFLASCEQRIENTDSSLVRPITSIGYGAAFIYVVKIDGREYVVAHGGTGVAICPKAE